MAKTDNLKDFLIDVADAIREKTGTTEPINPQDFSDTIKGIQSGGGVSEKNDVTFYDYNGTILHSYSKDDFLALTEMPPLPTREGLICQEWNWSIEDAQEHMRTNVGLIIGATYITDDGKTRLYIRIAVEGRMDVPLSFSQTIANGVVIDWGDGSETQTLSGTGQKNTTHHYNDIGDYCITLNPVEGCDVSLGYGLSGYSVLGNVNTMTGYANMLQRCEIGRGVSAIGAAFSNCYSLTSIVIPKGVTSIGAIFTKLNSLSLIALPQGITTIASSAFQACYNLASIVIPGSVASIGSNAFYQCYTLTYVVLSQGVTSIGSKAFQNCFSLASIVIPEGVTSIGTGLFDSCYSLSSVVIPQSVTSLKGDDFRYCRSLASIVIPQGVTSLSDEMCSGCYALTSIVIPSSVTSISANALTDCKSLAYCDFSELVSVPSLANTNVFSGVASDCKIVVPDALYDEWIAATNWSSHASKIIKKSEWDAQNA